MGNGRRETGDENVKGGFANANPPLIGYLLSSCRYAQSTLLI